MKLNRLMDEYDSERFILLSNSSRLEPDGEWFRYRIVYGIDFSKLKLSGVRIGPTIFMYCNFSDATFTDTKVEQGKPIVFAGCNDKGNVSGVDFLSRT